MDTQTPTSPLSQDQKLTVAKIKQAHTMLETRFQEFRAQALKSYRYVCGDQIDHDILKELRAERRPALIFNLMQPLIVYLAGMLSQNRQAMKATPLRFGDEALAEIHSVLVSDFAMEGCDGYEEIVKAAIDAVIGKVGWTNNHWGIRDNPEGKWFTESTDPFMILWDPDGRKEDQTDWRYQDVSAMFGAEEILSIYGDEIDPAMQQKIKDAAARIEGPFRKLGQPVGWLDRILNFGSNLLQSWRGVENVRDGHGGLIDTFLDARNGIYRVIEWHERRSVVRKWVYSPQTRAQIPIPADKENDQAFISSLMQQNPSSRIISIPEEQMWVVVCAPGLLPDDIILEKPYAVQGKGFQHKPIFCYTFHPDLLQSTSIADALISPSDSYNQRRMTMLEYIMDSVNPKINAPKDSIDPNDLNAWLSKTRGVVRFYTPMGQLKPEPQAPTTDRSALQAFSEEDRDLVQKISGISPNSQGYRESANEPASLYAQRVQQGMVMMAYFNSHVLRAMRQIFRYCDASLQEFLTFPRQVRLLSEPPAGMPGVQVVTQGEQDAYWLRVNWPTMQGVMNDLTQGEYDFKPDFTQLGTTAKQMKFAEALEFVKTIAQINPQAIYLPEIFKLWDSPAAAKMQQYAEMIYGQMQAQQQAATKAAQDQQLLQQASGEAGLVSQAAQAQQQLDPVQQAKERSAA